MYNIMFVLTLLTLVKLINCFPIRDLICVNLFSSRYMMSGGTTTNVHTVKFHFEKNRSS